MNVDTVPEFVWRELATLAIATEFPHLGHQGKQDHFLQVLDDKFYRGLYETASGGARYVSWTEDDSVWQSFVNLFRAADEKPLAEAFGPTKIPNSVKPASVLNKGTASLQIDSEADENENVKGARTYEKYNDRPLAARFQFVVHAGAGIVLFNRMRRACQEYIHEKLRDNEAASVVQQWKVFGEAYQSNRSDSCVAYLAARIESEPLKVFIPYVWRNIKDIVDSSFEAMGMTKIQKLPIWGINLPKEEVEKRVLEEASEGSAGGLMAIVLKRAYLGAIRELSKPGKTVERDALIRLAKKKARSLVARLY